MNITLLNQINTNYLFDNSNTHLKNVKYNYSDDRNKNNEIDIKENLVKDVSTSKDWNLEGTVWYVGLQCPPDSKSSVPPCTGGYPNYQFTIKSVDGKYNYTVKTDLNGKFRIFLEPSSYIISTQNKKGDITTLPYLISDQNKEDNILNIKQDIPHPPINIMINSLLE